MDKIIEQLESLNTESSAKIVKFLKAKNYKAKTIDNIPCVNIDGIIYQIFANWIMNNKTEYELQKLEMKHFNIEYQKYLKRSIKAIV